MTTFRTINTGGCGSTEDYPHRWWRSPFTDDRCLRCGQRYQMAGVAWHSVCSTYDRQGES